ncbi:DUF2164 domain-containing protein [Aneurinibacillus aneurinilyticus]|jgi:uncharacterized protein (DUF2164 family)|uniref:DUF2164 domain-containing protein n=2 Tax=Aneurinibacillus aneurinilyticus TaxID=1391 RepID=A0A848CXB4_ANEAE|nr:DUF2164 domain-containing protein [Aneurinibacillus aneurinilyticus]ERI09762.1 hypothetical protein HMPREF0083_02127 [Aneurinibacillus aneurinilyticus ATCC 12856]MCI1694946.1 DUF2164 domain-containing protein [Aneurinibacillus aneurinilyticus]MED0670321.1 DUF2164 domain-containing protein [Aneurinibacillus aneurinilyticus]MED0707119.1 DUF2164 domain-containing protein [Aneurinibacillus aneurinilyticus]MED0723493.1 DUF2164 domain-containing protein [Aneurinibacillus aneurinilyticus]
MLYTKLPREQKLQIASNVQQYFKTELSEEIGQLAAEHLIDFMLKELSPYIYNKAIQDARSIVEQQMVSIEEELYALEKPIK